MEDHPRHSESEDEEDKESKCEVVQLSPSLFRLSTEVATVQDTLKLLKRKRIVQRGAPSSEQRGEEEGEEPKQRQDEVSGDHSQHPCMSAPRIFSCNSDNWNLCLIFFPWSTATSKRPKLSRKAFLLEDDMDNDSKGSQEEKRYM